MRDGDNRPLLPAADGQVVVLHGQVIPVAAGHQVRGQATAQDMRYYYDPARPPGRSCDEKKMVKADMLEDQIDEMFQQLQLPDDWREQVRVLIGAVAQEGEQERERARLESQMDRIKALFRYGDISETDYAGERASLQASLAALKPARWLDVEKAAELVKDLGNVWRAGTTLDSQQLLRVMLEAIIVKSGWITGIEVKPDFHLLFYCSCGPGGLRVAGSNIAILPPAASAVGSVAKGRRPISKSAT